MCAVFTCATSMAFIAICLLLATIKIKYSRRNDSQSFTYIQAFVLVLRFKNTIDYYYHGYTLYSAMTV